MVEKLERQSETENPPTGSQQRGCSAVATFLHHCGWKLWGLHLGKASSRLLTLDFVHSTRKEQTRACWNILEHVVQLCNTLSWMWTLHSLCKEAVLVIWKLKPLKLTFATTGSFPQTESNLSCVCACVPRAHEHSIKSSFSLFFFLGSHLLALCVYMYLSFHCARASIRAWFFFFFFLRDVYSGSCLFQHVSMQMAPLLLSLVRFSLRSKNPPLPHFSLFGNAGWLAMQPSRCSAQLFHLQAPNQNRWQRKFSGKLYKKKKSQSGESAEVFFFCSNTDVEEKM